MPAKMGFKMGKKVKKSKLQLHRDAEKKKKEEAEAETARVLQESMDYFDADDEPGACGYRRVDFEQKACVLGSISTDCLCFGMKFDS